ncbi:MAG TPA: DUF5132 domain-containing protein [Blastocatellia bacterium]|nr:DUF5132 domain-containing protein [Blastocatellia bacterium]
MSDTRRKNASRTDGSFHTDVDSAPTANEGSEKEPDFATKVATVGVIGVGVALIEVSLIPGMVIGLAAALAPKYAPKIGEGLRPLLRQTVRGAVKLASKTREMISEASEQVQDIVAEARLEDAQEAATAPRASNTNAA